MEEVKDQELLKKLNAPVEQQDVEVTDENLLKQLNVGQKDEGFIKQAVSSVADFFSGTKRTEYEDLPEIGSYRGQGAAKIALGLNLTPNQKTQSDIIKAQVPGTTIINDKFGNPVVKFPDGQAFYLNKPGASFQDFVQTTSQILQYIPGQGYALKKAGEGLVKRSLYSGIAGGGTSVVQDLATIPLGSKEGVDPIKAGLSAAIPATFEGILNPVGKTILRKIIGNPKFAKDGVLNARGERAAKAAGLDPKSLDKDFVKKFDEELSKGVRVDVAAAEAGAGRFGFSLTKSQALGDEEGFARLISASKGSYGENAQNIARGFLKQQNIDIENSAYNLARKFSKGQFENIDDAGEQIIKGVFNEAKKQDDKVATLYNAIDKDAIFNAQESNIAVLPQNVKASIRVKGSDIIDTKLTPNTVRAIQDVRSFVKEVKGTPKRKAIVKDLNDFENLRKKLNNYKVNAFGNPNLKMDYKNLAAIVDEFDDFYDDALDNLLFSGDAQALNIIKQARSENRIKNQLFGVRKIQARGMKIDDKAGKVVVKILSDPDITPSETINYIFGSSTLGAKQGSKEIVKRLKEIFGVDGSLAKAGQEIPDFQALRTAAFQKIIKDSTKQGRFSPESMSRLWDNATKQSMPVLKELYDPSEIKLIDQFIKEVRKTFKPQDLVNHSNTASAISRAIQQVGRALFGITGFKLGNIQGLLAARGAFDRAKDLSGQKAAKKLIEKEIIRVTPPAVNPYLTAVETGTILQDLGRGVNAPSIPGILNNRNQ